MKKLIMLVDDDLDDRFFFAMAIHELHSKYDFIEAETCHGAFKLLDTLTQLPDYIFLDLNMPAQNGKECLRLSKKDTRFLHIPVIIYTTSVSPRDINDVYELGAAWHFQKPMNTALLCSKIKEALDSIKV